MPEDERERTSSLSRRSALGVLGATAAATTAVLVTGAAGGAVAAADQGGKGHGGGPQGVSLKINGKPGKTGTYAFPAQADTFVLDNGLIRFTFGRDDAAGGAVTGWTDTSITATSVVVDGTELAHNLNGVDPRDPDRQHSFYVDAGGGKSRLVCSQVRVRYFRTRIC